MLTKKQGNNSAAIVPVTTAYAMFGKEQAFDGKATMALQPMISEDKIFYPGTNALVIGEHQTYNTDTHDFSNINQGIDLSLYTGSEIATHSWGYNNTLTGYLDSYYWRDVFNRFRNWIDYAPYPNDESANYYSGKQGQCTKYNDPEQVETEYDVNISNTYVYLTMSPNDEHSGNLSWWYSYARPQPEYYRFIYDGTSFFEMSGQYFISATIINSAYPVTDPAYSALGITTASKDFGTYADCNRVFERLYKGILPNLSRTTLSDIWAPGQYALKFTNKVHETFYTSGVTAKAFIWSKEYDPEVTGTNLQISFDSIGQTAHGIIKKDDTHFINVTADVTYEHEENGEIDYDVADYNWGPITGDYETGGGGGGFSANITVYPPYANKKLLNVKNKCTLTPISDYKGYKTVINHDIPNYYGGAILFSADNLSQYFNNNEKFYCIGLKGISYTATGDSVSDSLNLGNWCGKFYKFSADHFRRINNNVFEFHDDELGNIYSCFENDQTSGAVERKFAPIGPFFVKFNGYTYVNDEHGQESKMFNITDDDNFDIPIVLNTINYIKGFDPDKEIDPRFILAKPAKSICYPYTDSFDKNQGNTDDYAYLNVYKPYMVLASEPLLFNSNVKEITYLGESCSVFTAIYRNNSPLSELTAIKSDWSHCNNVTAMSDTFRDAKKLKSIPDSWNGFDNIDNLYHTFENCISLEAIPDSWTGLETLKYTNNLFCDCKALTGIPDSWEGLGNLSQAIGMFMGCNSLKKIPESLVGLNSLTYAYAMFSGCTGLTDTFTSWEGLPEDVSLVAMFSDCISLSGIPNSWEGAKYDSMAAIFQNCSALKTIPTSWSGLKTIHMGGYFNGCGITAVPDSWSGLDTIESMNHTFANCTALSSIPTDLFEKCLALTAINNAFAGCTALTSDIKPIMDAGNSKFGMNDYAGITSAFMDCINVSSYDTLTADNNYRRWFGLPMLPTT